MKKIFLMIALVLGAVTMQSCKETQFGVDYSATITGDADGYVGITVPVGTINLDGKADVDVNIANDYIFGAVDNTTDYVLTEAVNFKDARVAEIANEVNEWVDKNIRVSVDTTQAQGSYYLLVKFRVRERVTGLTFSGEKELTNRTTPPNAK